MPEVEHNGARWFDHGSKGTKKEAVRFARWMHRGGFRTAFVKRDDGWHVLSGGHNAKGERDHAMIGGSHD